MSATLRSKDIPLNEVARLTGYNQGELSQMLLNGRLGPSVRSTDQAKMPLFHLAALFTLQQGAKVRAPSDQLNDVLFNIAGAAYVRLAHTEHANGRCVIRPGTDSRQLWSSLKLGNAKTVIEQQFPLNGMKTKRFAYFGEKTVTLYDVSDLSDVEFEDSPTFIDSWGIARKLQRSLIGTLFWTEPALV